MLETYIEYIQRNSGLILIGLDSEGGGLMKFNAH